MPRKIVISKKDMGWLRRYHTRRSYPAMAARLGCCVDTVKRILMREGLQSFNGAKYQPSRRNDEARWQRPCMRCGSRRPRPRHLYFCNTCRKNLEED